MTITEVPFETYLGVVLMAIVGLCVGLFLLRKNKREEVFQTWAEKWGK